MISFCKTLTDEAVLQSCRFVTLSACAHNQVIMQTLRAVHLAFGCTSNKWPQNVAVAVREEDRTYISVH